MESKNSNQCPQGLLPYIFKTYAHQIFFRKKMASAPKKVKTDDINQVVKTAISDMDTDLKAVCYDLSKNKSKPAIATIERVRRKLQALDGRTKYPYRHTVYQVYSSTGHEHFKG
jgi:hypothetical protein